MQNNQYIIRIFESSFIDWPQEKQALPGTFLLRESLFFLSNKFFENILDKMYIMSIMYI